MKLKISFRSWARTLFADLVIEFTVSLLIGLQALMADGDITKASLIALGSALATATLRTAMKKVEIYLKK